MEIILAKGTRKNNYKKKKDNFLRKLNVWRNFSIRSGKKKFSEPQDYDWWMPIGSRIIKPFLRDESKLALEWANREYELDYHDVEFRKI